MTEEWRTFSAESLSRFVAGVLLHYGLPPEDAEIGAEILVRADLMGIDSHGVAHLAPHISYALGLKRGEVNPRPNIRITRETASTAVIDGDRGLGLVISYRAMKLAIQKAKETGVGMVAVANSQHYGAAGYYALMAISHDMIGISMTNCPPIVVPTFARHKLIGSNPIAVAVPTGEEPPFLLDMATSTVAQGKLEIALREGKPMPRGWAVNKDGNLTENPADFWDGGALLPLGTSSSTSSYKGYGLAMVVDILAGILSGQGYSLLMHPQHREYAHFFGAVRVDCFQPVAQFKAMVDQFLRAMRLAEPDPQEERVLYPGLKEYEAERKRREKGIPLHPRVVASLEKLAEELGMKFPSPL